MILYFDKFELSKKGELMINGEFCLTQGRMPPVEVAEMIHVFAHPIPDHHGLAMMVFTKHHSTMYDIDVALSWLGIPADTEWEARAEDKVGGTWGPPMGLLRGSDSLAVGNLEPYVPKFFLVLPLAPAATSTPTPTPTSARPSPSPTPTIASLTSQLAKALHGSGAEGVPAA